MRSLFALVLAIAVAGPAFAQAPASALAPALSQTAGDRNFVLFFPAWSAAFDPAGDAVIAAAAQVALAHPGDPVDVTGYADPTGTGRANALISALRAQQVADALVAAGVAETRIVQHSMGPTDFQLVAQESRRVKIAVGAP